MIKWRFVELLFSNFYDRRYLDERESDRRNPWTHEKEEQVKKVTQKLRPRYQTTLWFKTEFRAYRQLEPLQGTCVPRFYGVTLFDDRAPLAAGVDTDVLGILLEFIEGVTLEELDPESGLAINNPHIGQAAVNCFEKIIPFGVLHGDARLVNIVIKPDGRVC